MMPTAGGAASSPFDGRIAGSTLTGRKTRRVHRCNVMEIEWGIRSGVHHFIMQRDFDVGPHLHEVALHIL